MKIVSNSFDVIAASKMPFSWSWPMGLLCDSVPLRLPEIYSLLVQLLCPWSVKFVRQ